MSSEDCGEQLLFLVKAKLQREATANKAASHFHCPLRGGARGGHMELKPAARRGSAVLLGNLHALILIAIGNA